MERKITVEIERTLKTIDLKDGLVAYQDIIIDKQNNRVQKREGICQGEILEKVQGLEDLNQYSFREINLKNEKYRIYPYLVSKDFCEKVRTCLFWDWREGSEVKELRLQPYTWLETHPDEAYDIVYYCAVNENFYDTKLNILPKAMNLTYINGQTDDLHFDLEKLQAFIESECKFEVTCELKEIPYYNRDSDDNLYYLDIEIHPTKEIYQKIVEADFFNRYKGICEEVGFNEFRL